VKVLVTGVAGFIGYHTAQRLLRTGAEVIGIDNLNNYYDTSLKLARLAQLAKLPHFRFKKLDLADRPAMAEFFRKEQPQRVVHLGAQAGVRFSLEAPNAYVDSNLVGFVTVLEGCRMSGVEHLVYASSSSVYGNNKAPFSTTDKADHPLSLYAATKRANELMAYSYSHLFRMPTTGLRFFTVYGPWGRPDMAPTLFAKSILEGRPIDLFNYGRMRRDFTYIDDIVEGIMRIMDHFPKANPPHSLFNIGSNSPVELTSFVQILEQCLGKTVPKNLLPLQPGDAIETAADISDLERETGFRPRTPLDQGLAVFCDWYLTYYGPLTVRPVIAPLASKAAEHMAIRCSS
jgi:UDP-glucuronate 4-epimerase